MEKRSLKIYNEIDYDINIGANVHLIDGSGLTSLGDLQKEFYIVRAYPELGINKPLENYTYEVVEIRVKDFGVVGVYTFYVQDIVIKHPSGFKFRTCSMFVRKIKNRII